MTRYPISSLESFTSLPNKCCEPKHFSTTPVSCDYIVKALLPPPPMAESVARVFEQRILFRCFGWILQVCHGRYWPISESSISRDGVIENGVFKGGKKGSLETRKYSHVVSFCFWKLKRLKEVNITFRQTWSCRSVYPTPEGAFCAGHFSIYLCKRLSRPLADYLPRGRYGYVQITSRDNSLGYRLIEGSHDPMQVTRLEWLGRLEARSLLQRKLLGGNELRNEEADELADALWVFTSYNNSGRSLFEWD